MILYKYIIELIFQVPNIFIADKKYILMTFLKYLLTWNYMIYNNTILKFDDV